MTRCYACPDCERAWRLCECGSHRYVEVDAEDVLEPWRDCVVIAGPFTVRCGVKHEGYPFRCQLPPRHTGPHEDWSVSVGGGPWTWEDQ